MTSQIENSTERYLQAWDRAYDEHTGMVRMAWPSFFSNIHSNRSAHEPVCPTRLAADYALALLCAGETQRVERAATILGHLLDHQDTDPVSRTYGLWPYIHEESLAQMKHPDWNWADFIGVRLSMVLGEHAAALPAGLRDRVGAALGHAAWSIFRRNMHPGYTNIAVMGAAVTLAAGQMLDDPLLLTYGRRRLRRIVEHVQDQGTAEGGGFNEYNCPGYTMLAMEEVERILQLVRDPQARADAQWLRGRFWRDIAEHFHPGTSQWAGPQARSYTEYLPIRFAERLAELTGATIPPHPKARPFDEEIYDAVDHLPCPEPWTGRFHRLPEDPCEVRRRYIRRDDEAQSVWGATWMSDAACLGSVNHGSFWTQARSLLAYWRTEDDPAVVFLARFWHDGRDFASAGHRVTQRGPRALSVVTPLLDAGDWHPTMDRPAEPIFDAEDFRLRYELAGQGVSSAQLDEHRFELRAGRHRVVLHTTPVAFAGQAVRWRAVKGDDRVAVEAVFYQGPRRPFDLRTWPDALATTGIELLGVDEG